MVLIKKMVKIDHNKLESLVTNEFESSLLKASIKNLNDKGNKLRLNNFAYSVRELSRHILNSHSPDIEVKSCVWYTNESGDSSKVTRGERIKYAIQGGLTDKFLEEEIMHISDLNNLKKEVIKSINTLSKYTHINEKNFNLSNIEVEKLSSNLLESFGKFHQTLMDCRSVILKELNTKIDNEFIEQLYESTFDEIDILSSHHTVESYSTSSIKITDINSCSIEMEVNGTVDVNLKYGSNSDFNRGDGLEIETAFPFTSSLSAKLTDKLPNSKISIIVFEVDTSSWFK